MPQMKALWPIYGDYPSPRMIAQHEIFECDEATADALAARGQAVFYVQPPRDQPVYETKPLVPHMPAPVVVVVPKREDKTSRRRHK